MGVKGLSTYIEVHLGEVLVRHKLHNCNVVIDGNNLAHCLYYECTGINPAFGGDYDKYAAYIREYFEKLWSCEVRAMVVMDGGQPLDNSKFRTVRERVVGQVNSCVDVTPSNQLRHKIFPAMGRQVFVSVVKSLGVPVYQTDFEADEEIAALARKLDMTVITNDSDFYIFDVPFVRLDSINHKNVVSSKKTNKYMACYRFSREKFCELTDMNREHLPLLATLLGNDYLPYDHFTKFYEHVNQGTNKNRVSSSRHATIKNVISWLATRKNMGTGNLIKKVTTYTTTSRLSIMMKKCVANYTDTKTNLISFIESSKHSTEKAGDFVPITEKYGSEDAHVETDLVLKNGQKLPNWFLNAYRLHIIPREVTDIMTQCYFISPPMVEEISKQSSYMAAKPIVKYVFTMLWQGVQYSQDNRKSKKPTNPDPVQEGTQASSVQYDSDVILEDDDDQDDPNSLTDNEDEEAVLSKEMDKMNIESRASTGVTQPVQVSSKKCGISSSHGEVLAKKKSKQFTQRLRWFVRNKRTLKAEMIKISPDYDSSKLPTIHQVSSMSVSKKKAIFYSILCSKQYFRELDVPADLELILDIIVYWFRHSLLPLSDTHALAVLACVFMFYIIDGRIGRVRTRKAFEEAEKCQVKLADIQNNPEYCRESDNVKQLLAQITWEECLVAGSKLFRFHHLDQKLTDKKYCRQSVHAFSEYQACIYFVQLLNSLLGTPFPMLSVERLWAGTFCYNIFTSVRKARNPVLIITKLFGKDTCLEALFLKLFKSLSEALKLRSSSDNVDVAQNKIKGRAEQRKKMEELRKEAPVKDGEVPVSKVESKEDKNSSRGETSAANNRFATLLDNSDNSD